MQVKISDEINPKELLTQCIKISEMIWKDAAVLLESSQNALLKYDDKIGGDLDENRPTEQSSVLPYWDPGLRSSKLRDNQKKYLIKQGPHQPKLPKFLLYMFFVQDKWTGSCVG